MFVRLVIHSATRELSRTMTHIDLIGVPIDLGASRRGVDMGPFAVRAARIREELLALGLRDEEAIKWIFVDWR